MITYSIIQKSQLEGGLRLDAEYYQPEYSNLISKIKSQKSKVLGELSNIAYGTTPTGGVFEGKGIPFVRSQNFSNLLIDTSDLVFCTEKFHHQNKKSAIRHGDILFAAVGATIGEVAIVQDEIVEGNINQNIARVRISDKTINPYFVGFFFASTPGQLQIERLMTGNAQPYLNSEQIRSFIVPIFDIELQNKIADYFQEIQKQIKLSRNLYSQAENLLLEELGLRDFKIEDDLSYIVNLSDIKSSHRADAEYFQPKYDKIINALGENKQILKTVASRKTKKVKIIKEDDYKYIEISDINVGNGDVSFNVIKGSELPANAKMKIEGGELVVSKVRPTRGAIAIIPDDWNEGFVASGAFSIFETESPLREYLQVVLRSIIGKIQLEKPTTGTSYPTVTDEDIENLQIPILLKSAQQKIADLVQKSHEARSKAKQLLGQAKCKVEQLIEFKK